VIVVHAAPVHMDDVKSHARIAIFVDMILINIGAKFALHQKDAHTANPRKASVLYVSHVPTTRSNQIVCNAINVIMGNTKIAVISACLACIVNMANGKETVQYAIHAFMGKTKKIA
jgi:hypothetical protein